MTFEDLPSDIRTTPLTDPQLRADLIDLIVGEEDQITPLAVAREMHARINLSRLFIIPGAGHMALLEQPQAVNDALVDWAA